MNVKPNTCKQAGSTVYKHHWISIKSLVFLFKSIDIIHQLMTHTHIYIHIYIYVYVINLPSF